MKSILKPFAGVLVLSLFVSGCCKHKSDDICNPTAFNIQPFVEKRHVFQCNGNSEYTYIFRKKEEIDSLDPTCFFIVPVAFPVVDTNMVYIMIGRMSYHYRDTFSFTQLVKDTCGKKVVYEANMFQTDTAVNCCPYGISAVKSMFCSVENIPPDYQVEVKYKYVPLPE